MRSIRFTLQVLLLLIIIITTAGCDTILGGQQTALQGSGVVEVTEVVLALETDGQVSDVYVSDGDQVKSGDVLVTLSDDLLKTQYDQAVTTLEQAQANYDLIAAQPLAEQRQVAIANAQLELLSAQQDLKDLVDNNELANAKALQAVEDARDALNEVDEHFAQQRAAALTAIAAAEEAVKQANHNLYYFTLPQSQQGLDLFEGITQMTAALEKAREAYEPYKNDQVDYNQAECLNTADINRIPEICRVETTRKQLKDDLEDAEGDLSTAVRRLALEVELKNSQADLEKAITDYQTLGESPSQADIALLEAQLASAERDYAALQDGPDPDDLALAEARVQSAQANLALAQTDTTQEQLDAALAEVNAAQAALEIVQVQYEKLELTAPVDGVVLYRTIEPGEVVLPGSPAITLGLLHNLKITVYIPEDRYGQIDLGDNASVTVDSFPGEIFNATVIRIADQAEYTPRNVQTAEDRRTTVFAVELSVEDPQGKLKPGMPADVVFEE